MEVAHIPATSTSVDEPTAILGSHESDVLVKTTGDVQSPKDITSTHNESTSPDAQEIVVPEAQPTPPAGEPISVSVVDAPQAPSSATGTAPSEPAAAATEVPAAAVDSVAAVPAVQQEEVAAASSVPAPVDEVQNEVALRIAALQKQIQEAKVRIGEKTGAVDRFNQNINQYVACATAAAPLLHLMNRIRLLSGLVARYDLAVTAKYPAPVVAENGADQEDERFVEIDAHLKAIGPQTPNEVAFDDIEALHEQRDMLLEEIETLQGVLNVSRQTIEMAPHPTAPTMVRRAQSPTSYLARRSSTAGEAMQLNEAIKNLNKKLLALREQERHLRASIASAEKKTKVVVEANVKKRAMIQTEIQTATRKCERLESANLAQFRGMTHAFQQLSTECPAHLLHPIGTRSLANIEKMTTEHQRRITANPGSVLECSSYAPSMMSSMYVDPTSLPPVSQSATDLGSAMESARPTVGTAASRKRVSIFEAK